MIATFINCAAVVLGCLLGLLLHRRISEDFKNVVFTGIGLVTLVLGMMMALKTQRVLYLALSVVCGGILGNWWNIEGGTLRLGEFLKSRFSPEGSASNFAHAFLNASVLFCVGAMTLVGSFKAGTEGDYTLILTKSVMDGFVSILLAAAMGVGTAFSALTILVYQGGLTLAAGVIKPYVTPLILSELTGLGGVMVLMIGFNLLQLKTIKTANYLPGLVLVVLLVLLEPLFPFLAG
jgi:uncharacterized membrane protein YqgA involved in biofilm formation